MNVCENYMLLVKQSSYTVLLAIVKSLLSI